MERERGFRIESVWFLNFFLHTAKKGRVGSCLGDVACVVLSGAKAGPLCGDRASGWELRQQLCVDRRGGSEGRSARASFLGLGVTSGGEKPGWGGARWCREPVFFTPPCPPRWAQVGPGVGAKHARRVSCEHDHRPLPVPGQWSPVRWAQPPRPPARGPSLMVSTRPVFGPLSPW